jgi:hypothetical protein
VILKGFKRKQSDLSPEAAIVSKKKSASRFEMVGVLVPPPPQPYANYLQLGSPPGTSSVALSVREPMGPPPPLSTSPSLSSFDSSGSGAAYGSGQHFRAAHLQILLSTSQEDLRLTREQFDEEREFLRRRHEERERQQRESFEVERAFYESRIVELEKGKRGEGSGASHRG